jgi:pimeloyl-ACP methyl ester carboxylesterase
MIPGAREAGVATEKLAERDEVVLCYEEFGDRERETVVLVMGLGVQMLGWQPAFCEGLAERGFHVVRFDNRDVGRSTKFSGRVNLTAGLVGLTGSSVYTLAEMAADTSGLIDHLGLDAAHLVGVSMGAMIGQTLAARHPGRVLSLCSIMSGTGHRSIRTTPHPKILRQLLRRPASTREEFVEGLIATFQVIGSPAYPPDPTRLRALVESSYERGHCPAGFARQMMAIMASGNRTKELRGISAPTVVIHGDSDRLVPIRAGRETAAAIPGASLEVFTGMGHDLPEALWPRFLDLIEANARSRQGAVL